MKVFHFPTLALLLLVICFPLLTNGQKSYNLSDLLQNDPHWVVVKDIPKDKLPKGAVGCRFYVNNNQNVISLFKETSGGKLVEIKTWTDQCVYNMDKGSREAFWVNGRVSVCSELSGNATTICCIFNFNEDVLEFMGVDMSHQSEDLLYKGDSLLAKGEIAAAISAYKAMTLPSSYMNLEGKGIEILEAAYPLAQEAYALNQYEKAASLMEVALNYYGNRMLKEDAFESLEALEKYEKENWKISQSIKELLETYTADYAMYLYKSGKLPESISLNTYLAALLPNLPNPCLYWGDALYDMGKVQYAKQPYLIYMQRMEKLGFDYEIPQRVLDRVK